MVSSLLLCRDKPRRSKGPKDRNDDHAHGPLGCYPERVIRLAVTFAFAGAMLSACFLGGGECPCGASTSDPIGSHDTSFSGDHVVDGQCLCTCGHDFPESFDDNGDCREHQTDCTDSDGNEDMFVCR